MSRITSSPTRLRLDDVVDVLLEKGVDAALPGYSTKVKKLEQQVVKDADTRGDWVGAKLVRTPVETGLSERFVTRVRKELEADVFTPLEAWRRDDGRHALPRTAAQNAVLEALADASDENGWLTEEDAERVLGAEGKTLFAQLSHLLDGGLRDVPTTRPIAKFNQLSEAAQRKVALSARRKDFAERMPALAAVTKALGGPEALKGFSMTSVQHLFPTTIALYDQLEQNGVQRRQMGIEGKPYSANRDVLHKLHAEDFHIHDWGDFIFGYVGKDGDTTFSSFVPKYALVEMFLGLDAQTGTWNYSDEELRAMVKVQIPKWEKSGKKFLLLDDGGHLVEALHQLFPEAAHLCVGVEQTMSGANRLKGIDLKCPVVNMAECELKKHVENVLIGESVASDIEREVREAGAEVKPKVATILGYGAVGRGTAEALRRRGYEVHVWDPDPAAMARADADGCTATTREEALAHAHLLVGCSGKTSLTVAEYDQLPQGAVLANAGSGNYELGMNTELPKDPNLEVDATGMASTKLGDQTVRVGEGVTEQIQFQHRVVKDRLVLRGGFVVNMTRDMPPEYAQLIRGMLLASCLQAAKESEPGLHLLSTHAQGVVREATEGSLAKAGLSLDQPDFTQCKPCDW